MSVSMLRMVGPRCRSLGPMIRRPFSSPAAAGTGAAKSTRATLNATIVANAKKVRTKSSSKHSRFVTVGLPLLLFVVGGYATLTQFVGGKYEARDHRIKSQSTRAFNLDEEHKKMTKKLLLDDFELKPVPRPDEPQRK